MTGRPEVGCECWESGSHVLVTNAGKREREEFMLGKGKEARRGGQREEMDTRREFGEREKERRW